MGIFTGYPIFPIGLRYITTIPKVVQVYSILVPLELVQFTHVVIPWHVSDTQFRGVVGLLGWYQMCCLPEDSVLGKKLLHIVAQFFTDSVLSTDCRCKVGAKGCLGHMLSPKSIRLGNSMDLLGARGRGM